VSVFTGGANSADPGEQLGGTHTFGVATGRNDDVMFDESARQSTSGIGIFVTVRRATGVTGGTPDAGRAKRPVFQDTTVPAYLWSVQPGDVYQPGGFFQLGDIVLGFEEAAVRYIGHELRSSQSESDTEGDRILFPIDADDPLRVIEYRIVGTVDFNPIGPVQVVRKVLCRKVALPS
jgi:hypothetical protein